MMNDFLKKYSLPLGLKWATRKHKSTPRSPGYKESKKFLILFTSEGNQKIALVKRLQNQLEKEGKTVKCLYFLSSEEDKPDVHLDEGMECLKPEDFTFFGDIRKPSAAALVNEEFDFIIHIDHKCSIYTDLVLARSKAKCRIGKYFKEHEAHYDMMVRIPKGKKINYLVEQIYHYTKAL